MACKCSLWETVTKVCLEIFKMFGLAYFQNSEINKVKYMNMIDTTKQLPNNIVELSNLRETKTYEKQSTKKPGIYCTNSQLSLISLHIHYPISLRHHLALCHLLPFPHFHPLTPALAAYHGCLIINIRSIYLLVFGKIDKIKSINYFAKLFCWQSFTLHGRNFLSNLAI